MNKLLLIALISLLTACSQAPNESFTAEGAWVREPPPNAGALAGYVTITNNTEQDHLLSSANSEQFNVIEIHRTIVENGVAKMRLQKDLPIPAGGSLVLEPGSYHLMLMTPKTAFKANDQVTVTLELKADDDIKQLNIIMPVKKPTS